MGFDIPTFFDDALFFYQFIIPTLLGIVVLLYLLYLFFHLILKKDSSKSIIWASMLLSMIPAIGSGISVIVSIEFSILTLLYLPLSAIISFLACFIISYAILSIIVTIDVKIPKIQTKIIICLYIIGTYFLFFPRLHPLVESARSCICIGYDIKETELPFCFGALISCK